MNGFYWIYLVMFGLLLGYQLAETERQKRIVYCTACGFLIFCFAVKDFGVSVDTAEYLRQYAIVPTLRFGQLLEHKFELGYNLMCILLAKLFTGERVLIVAVSLASLVPFFRWFYRETEEPMIALMAFLALGMYLHAMIFYRQLCAMAIMTFAYRYVRERKLGRFLLVLLAAASFHKTVLVMAVIYVAYRLPVNRWTLLGAMGCSAVLGLAAKPMMQFFYDHIYNYGEVFLKADGGWTMLAVLWIFVWLVYGLMGHRLAEPKIRLWFAMVLIAAVIQPVVFAFYNWCRIVLFFRVAMVMLIPELYVTLFRRKEGNRLLLLLKRFAPGLHGVVLKAFGRKWFETAVQLAMFAVLFVWYVSELCGAVYTMAPLGF